MELSCAAGQTLYWAHAGAAANGTSASTGVGASNGAVASGGRLQSAQVTGKVTSAEEYAEARAAMVRLIWLLTLYEAAATA